MPTTFNQAHTPFGGAQFTFAEFSVAYELSLVKDGKRSRKEIFERMFEKDKEKKKKVIELILKVKGKTIKDKAKIPTDVDIALSNIDLVIQEVLKKPSVNIYA